MGREEAARRGGGGEQRDTLPSVEIRAGKTRNTTVCLLISGPLTGRAPLLTGLNDNRVSRGGGGRTALKGRQKTASYLSAHLGN